jgi:UPF0755 protein
MKKRHRRFLLFLFVVVFVCGALGAVAFLTFGKGVNLGGGIQLAAPKDLQQFALSIFLNTRSSDLTAPAGKDDTPIEFTIEPNESIGEVSNALLSLHLIKDADLFRRYLQYNGQDASVEAGKFELNQAMTIPQIAQALQKGKIEEVSVTIPEGKRIEEVAELVAQQVPITATDFLALAKDPAPWKAQYPFLNELPPKATLEGYLFPDTYSLPKDKISAHDLINRMLSNFNTKLTTQMRSDIQASGRTLFDVVRLASIVEREAVVADERPRIAGVYSNRLTADMALDADPTVQYALGNTREPGHWWPQITQDDYQGVQSNYNLYLTTGLTPGPIANAGFSSLKAAAYPEKNPYYFFRASCAQDGTHVFAKTIEEQIAHQCP